MVEVDPVGDAAELGQRRQAQRARKRGARVQQHMKTQQRHPGGDRGQAHCPEDMHALGMVRGRLQHEGQRENDHSRLST